MKLKFQWWALTLFLVVHAVAISVVYLWTQRKVPLWAGIVGIVVAVSPKDMWPEFWRYVP